jgi:hypothetical protein
MRVKQTFVTTVVLFFVVWGFFSYASESSKTARIEQLNRQIEELQNIKRGYAARASRFNDQAERLQFQDRSLLESRRLSELADENTEKAARAQAEIDRLTLERDKLVQERK